MKHPNTLNLEKIYADFLKNDIQALLISCGEAITFQVPGKSRLAGKYNRNTFPDLITKLHELSEGSYKLELHDVLASEQHGAVLVTEKLMRDGKPVEFRMVHIWRFESGKPIAWYAYPRDLYQFDAAWG